MAKEFTKYKNSGTIKTNSYPVVPNPEEKKDTIMKKKTTAIPGLSPLNKFYSKQKIQNITGANYPKQTTNNTGGSNYLKATQNTAGNKNIKSATYNISDSITEKLEQDRIAKAAGKSIFRFVDDTEKVKYGTINEKRPDDYYRKFENLKDEIDKQKELFGPRTDFSITNYEKNFKMMNPDEQTMFTGKAQSFFNRNGYTDKNGQPLKHDGVWGPKTQKTYEKYREDNGFSNEKIAKNVNSPDSLKNPDRQNILSNDIMIDYENEVSEKFLLQKKGTAFSQNSIETENLLTYVNDEKPKKPTGKIDSSLSNSSQLIYKDFKASFMPGVKEKNPESFNDVLMQYMKKQDIRADTTQYAIFKLLRAINNEKISPSQKNMEVVDMLVSMMNTLTYNTIHKEHSPTLLDAISLTTKYNIRKNYNSVIKKWMKVYVDLSDSYYLLNDRVGKIGGTNISADTIDASINQMINKYNANETKIMIYLPAPYDTTQIVYDTNNKEAGYRIMYPLKSMDAGGKSIIQEDDYSNFFEENLKKW